MTTLVAYSIQDDGIIKSSDNSYSTARSGGILGAYPAVYGGVAIGQRLLTGVYDLYETFLGFDTASIGDTDNVSAATLSIVSEGDSSDTDFTIEARLYDWGGTLTTADWVPGVDLSGDTLLATYATSDGWTSATRYNLASEAAFLVNVNKTGMTYFCVSSSRMRSGDAPSGNEYVRAYLADEAGTTRDPKLTVTHIAPPPALSMKFTGSS